MWAALDIDTGSFKYILSYYHFKSIQYIALIDFGLYEQGNLSLRKNIQRLRCTDSLLGCHGDGIIEVYAFTGNGSWDLFELFLAVTDKTETTGTHYASIVCLRVTTVTKYRY